MTERTYLFPVSRVERIVDGDTYWLHLDVGFRQTQLTNIRLYGYDCPEVNSGSAFEKTQAKTATLLAYKFLINSNYALWVRTHKDPDNFGRWLGEVYAEPLLYLGEVLRSSGLASNWPTRWREEFDK